MLIVQGTFRSGTSVLFRTLRNDPARTCYYEPLHPNLLSHVAEAKAAGPDHPKSPLYAQYTPLLPRLRRVYRSSFWEDYATVRRGDAAAPLRTYVRLLADSAARTVLQLNRAFWMAPWLHQTFPDARFIHLVRDPRSVVWSQLTTHSGERVRMTWPLLGRLFSFSSGDLSNVFSRYAYHGAYQIQDYFRLVLDRFSHSTEGVRHWAYSCLQSVCECRPYVQALAVWGAQTRVCHREAQSAFGSRYLCIRYRDLCTAPTETLRRIYALYGDTPPSPVMQYAEAQVHADRVSSWRRDERTWTCFREGLRRARLSPALDELGYDSLLD